MDLQPKIYWGSCGDHAMDGAAKSCITNLGWLNPDAMGCLPPMNSWGFPTSHRAGDDPSHPAIERCLIFPKKKTSELGQEFAPTVAGRHWPKNYRSLRHGQLPDPGSSLKQLGRFFGGRGVVDSHGDFQTPWLLWRNPSIHFGGFFWAMIIEDTVKNNQKSHEIPWKIILFFLVKIAQVKHHGKPGGDPQTGPGNDVKHLKSPLGPGIVYPIGVGYAPATNFTVAWNIPDGFLFSKNLLVALFMSGNLSWMEQIRLVKATISPTIGHASNAMLCQDILTTSITEIADSRKQSLTANNDQQLRL